MSEDMTKKTADKEISITIPISQISEKIYAKAFEEESEPIYQKELYGKAIIAGKSIGLLKFKPTLRLEEIKIAKGKGEHDGKSRSELTGKAWFHLSPGDDAKKT